MYSIHLKCTCSPKSDISLCFICRCGYPDFRTTSEEIYCFIGILIARGVLCKGVPLKELWNKHWGSPCFSKMMARDRFLKILRFLRFDDKSTRRRRLPNDKFALCSQVFYRFIHNAQLCYNPHAYLTIDEQLFPSKVRCRFIQYMANKPDKFGIKFWLMVDNNSKYLVNGFPYLGKDDSRPNNMQLSEFVVRKLAEPWMNQGFNITCDNFFTSKNLAHFLIDKKTSIVGTIRANRVGMPPNLQEIMKKIKLHETVVANDGKCILTAYKCKRNKFVTLLSTLHESIAFEGPMQKPNTVIDYNRTKCGVDVLDQMARQYSTKIASRRWPMQVCLINLCTFRACFFPTIIISYSNFS